ncbi:MAG TPA: IS200/IS605 family transposase [Ignavibacteriaceae bacterium]|nr:IS200/IS605 family transposase [Ignavibacteriaceae bacterium]
MGQSLVKNYIHITFSTKHREKLIFSPIDKELHKYIAGICKNLDCYPLIVGGHTDHIHILCQLSKNIALKDLVKKVKAYSSKWIKTKGGVYKKFYWQDGYAAFSVKQSDTDRIIKYIKNQKEHHKKKSFQEEYRDFLKKYKVDYNEKYLWD